MDVLQGGGPAGVRIELPGADPAARGIDEDAVKFSFGGSGGAAVPYAGSIVEDSIARGASFQFFETPLGAVAGPDEAFIVHEIAEVKCLAAFAGAGVPPGLA